MDNNTTTDLSFLEKKDANAFSFKDFLFTILRNLHWFILFAALGAAIAWWISDRADRIYESHAKIKVYMVTKNPAAAGISLIEQLTSARATASMNTLNDEIIVLKSESAMREVARRLNLDMSYYYKTKLVKRTKDLYKDSPIVAELLDVKETDYANLLVTIGRDSLYVIDIEGETPVTAHLNDTVATRFGRVCIHPTWALRDMYFDVPIKVSHRNLDDAAASYRKSVTVTRSNASEGIIDLSLHDTSPQRAADILNEMISVYNENTINDKKEIIQQTSEYINTRIAQLDTELGAQESQIAAFKRQNQVLNVEDFGQAYMAASIESSEELERLRAEISHAQFLKSLAASGENKLFPVTVNIEDANIRSTISNYNNLVLKLDRYNESGTSNNPLVKDMLLEMQTLKINLNKLLASYIGSLEQKVTVVKAAGQRADTKIKSVPGGQMYLDNISRVQGIKEGLYLTLLSKREEEYVDGHIVGLADPRAVLRAEANA